MSKEIAAKIATTKPKKTFKEYSVPEKLTVYTRDEEMFWEKVYVSTLTPTYIADTAAVKTADKTARKHADRALKSRRKTFK